MVSHAIDSCRDDPTRWLVYIYHTKWYPLANRAITGAGRFIRLAQTATNVV
eukprot:COSAG01_NODE_3672_length_5809_cov_4.250263_1_plen_50_part_10